MVTTKKQIMKGKVKIMKKRRIGKTDKLTAIMLALLITVTGVLFTGCGSADAAEEKAAENGFSVKSEDTAEAVKTGESRIVPSDSSVTLDPGETGALVTSVDGTSITVNIGGFGMNGFGGVRPGDMAGGSGEDRSGGRNGFGRPDANVPADGADGSAQGGETFGNRGGAQEGGMRGGAQGGANGFSDLTGNNKSNGESDSETGFGELPGAPDGQTPPEMESGELPDAPDGQTPPEMGSGELPGAPDGQTPPEMGSGELPGASDGQTPPEMGSGELPGAPDGQTPPEMGSGELPDAPDGQTPPEMGSGEGFRGGKGGVSATITVADESIIERADGSSASLSEISGGSLLTVTIGENGSVTKIVIEDGAGAKIPDGIGGGI